MAHFAELNNENIVLRVVVICNEDCIDDNGNESEEKGIETCKRLFGQETIWVQTSYTGKIRKNYASAGFKYDKQKNIFIPPKPSEYSIFDEKTANWQTNWDSIEFQKF